MAGYGVYVEFAAEVAARAAALVKRNFLGKFAVGRKGDTSLVTAVDRAAEELIVAAIGERFPGHAVVAEEGSGREAESDWRWFVDPLDGTNNFAHGFPWVAVSLALAYEGEVVAAVVTDALRDETFRAARGAGARSERGVLRVSGAPRLSESLVATGFPYDKHLSSADNVANFGRVTKRVRGIRRAGAAALDLAYVAAGRLDGFWELKLSAWDTAAGALLVEEAGGAVSRFDGASYNPGDVDIVASNGRIHNELRTLLKLEG
jgi:myo-inositol-1(or 4)-monophosphatase